jgi:Arc/MetJ family transcription regulator
VSFVLGDANAVPAIHIEVYPDAPMGRTNVVVDDELVERVKSMYGLRTTREAIDFALRSVAGRLERNRAMLELEGAGWGGDLDELREGYVVAPIYPDARDSR